MGVGNFGENRERKGSNFVRENRRFCRTRVCATGSPSIRLPIVGNPKPTI